jgi:hypothetical protein
MESRALSLGVKRLGCEADNSPPSSAEFKNAWSYTSVLKYAFMAWCSVEAQGQLHDYNHFSPMNEISRSRTLAVSLKNSASENKTSEFFFLIQIICEVSVMEFLSKLLWILYAHKTLMFLMKVNYLQVLSME